MVDFIYHLCPTFERKQNKKLFLEHKYGNCHTISGCFFLLICVTNQLLILNVIIPPGRTKFDEIAVAFPKKLLWLSQTNVITLKPQMHAVKERRKRVSQLSFSTVKSVDICGLRGNRKSPNCKNVHLKVKTRNVNFIIH